MKIKLPNRENQEVYLEKEETGLWKLHVSLDHIRIGFDDSGKILFVDPPGGPFLQVGGLAGGRKIIKIEAEKEVRLSLEEENCIIQDSTSWVAYYQGDPRKFRRWLEEKGFIDASILSPSWYVFRNEVYCLPDNWRKSLIENEYVVLDYVGHVFHVIPKEEQTDSQYWFIKRILED